MDVSAGRGIARVEGRFKPGKEVRRTLIVEEAITKSSSEHEIVKVRSVCGRGWPNS